MKKIVSLVLVIIIALSFSLVGCRNDKPGVKTYRIGIALYQFSDNFMALQRDDLEEYIASLETPNRKFEVTVVDGKNDMITQSNQIDTFIAQGMDCIIMSLVQTSAADVMIDKITKAKIPLVLINREPLGDEGDESYSRITDNEKVCYVGAKAQQSGVFQGEMVVESPNHCDLNNDGVVSYVMIEGDPENPDAQYRTVYSIKTIVDAGVKVKCLDDQIGMWDTAKGQEVAANALAKYGDDIEVILCNNDAMALGAYAAIQAANRKVNEDIYLFGVDGLNEVIEMINKGKMSGTVFNDHYSQSIAAVDAALDMMNNKPVDSYIWIDYVKLTKEKISIISELMKKLGEHKS